MIIERIKKFEKILFRAPEFRKSFVLMVAFSLLFGSILVFTGEVPVFYRPIIDIFIYSFLIFFFPSAMYSVGIRIFFKKFTRDRSFLLGLINEILVFIGILISLGTNRYVVFVIGVLYTVNLFSVSGGEGKKGILPLLTPLIYFAPVFYLLNFFAIFNLTIIHFISIMGLGVAVMLCIYITEYFFHLNIPDMSAVSIVSSLINSDIADIGCGINIDTPLQKLDFKCNGKSFKMVIPWLHPGPIEGFGGGSMSTELIRKLNESGRGFFWHFPSSHEDDPANPSINDRIYQEEGEYVYYKKVTKLLKVSKGVFTIHGQKFEDFYIFFVEGEKKDDYDSMIFREIRSMLDEKVIFVDTHNHAPFSGHDRTLKYGEKEADVLREAVLGLKERLDNEEMYPLRVGSSISEENKFMVIIVEVDGNKYLFVTLDSNGISKRLTADLERFRSSEGYDQIIFLTTDAHDALNFLIKERGINCEKVEAAVNEAAKNIGLCEVGLMEKTMEDVKVLKDYWHMLHASLNYMLHFFPIALIVIYVAFFYLTFNLLV